MSQTIYIVLCKRRKAQLLEVIATETERGGREREGERERQRQRQRLRQRVEKESLVR